MLEWMITGNLGKDPEKNKHVARTSVCCNVRVQGTEEERQLWVDIQTGDIGMASLLLSLEKGDGVMARGNVRFNVYEHRGKPRTGWLMDINQLHITYRKH